MKPNKDKQTHGKRHGPGLKPGLNEADTGSKVGKHESHVGFGHMASTAKGRFATDPNVGRKRS